MSLIGVIGLPACRIMDKFLSFNVQLPAQLVLLEFKELYHPHVPQLDSSQFPHLLMYEPRLFLLVLLRILFVLTDTEDMQNIDQLLGQALTNQDRDWANQVVVMYNCRL